MRRWNSDDRGWRGMHDWSDQDWEEYFAFMFPSQEEVLKNVEDAIKNTRDSDDVIPV